MKREQLLQSGDCISLIAPSGLIKSSERLQKAIDFLEKSGYRVKCGKNIFAKNNYLAGTDEQRLEDLHASFTDESKIILCARGGYGCSRLLDKIDYNLIKAHPKPFFGHSDITALLNYLPTPTYLAPMAYGDFGASIDNFTKINFLDTLNGYSPIYKPNEDFFTITEGEAEGALIGGNLTVLTSTIGTPFAPDFSNKILILEDINEETYKIDRMLTQLKLAGVFAKVSAVIVATFEGAEISKEFLQPFFGNIPAFYGFNASHKSSKYTLELNVTYKTNTKSGTLERLR